MLRKYRHSGKFEGGLLIDSFLYDASMGGVDEEVGDTNEDGWYGLMDGELIEAVEAAATEAKEELTKEERDFLATQVGAIICEDKNGFISVEWFDDDDDLQEAWDSCCEGEYEPGEDSDDSDDEDDESDEDEPSDTESDTPVAVKAAKS